jgi:hypothetical protein
MPVDVPGAGEHVDFSSVRPDPSPGEVPDGLSCDARCVVTPPATLIERFPSEDSINRQ